MSHITAKDFTSINNDSYGNPRFVIHFLNISTENASVKNMYDEALNKTKSLGGKKFHNKQYGGGIVFSTYNLESLIKQLNELKQFTQNLKSAYNSLYALSHNKFKKGSS